MIIKKLLMLLLMITLTISLRIMNYDDDNDDKSLDMMYYTTYWREDHDDDDDDDDPLPHVFSNRSNTNSRHLQAWQNTPYPQMLSSQRPGLFCQLSACQEWNSHLAVKESYYMHIRRF